MRFEPGRRYHRKRDIHDVYGGQQRGGIITPAAHPLVLVVTGEGGLAHGYHDHWDEHGVFHYYGEGQVGDMALTGGNAAILRHSVDGEELHVFEQIGGGYLRYRGEMICAGYETMRDIDREGDERDALVFQMVPAEDDPGPPPEGEPAPDLEALRQLAQEDPTEESDGAESKRKVRRRSRALKTYVLARAGGVCEDCENPAPFLTVAGSPYLEVHHINRLSDSGPGRPDSAAGLCPTCHRRIHHAGDGELHNDGLRQKVAALEGRAA